MKKLLVLSLVALFASGLSLWAGGQGEKPAGSQGRVLEVWTHEFPPLQTGMTKKWIPEFEAKNPGVKVKMTAIPFAGVVSYDAKLLASLSGGGGPDVWDMGDWDYKTFLDNKFVAPLDPARFGYGSDQELIDAYPAGTLSVFIRDGKVYGLFSEYDTLALFYNLDMFEKAGVPPLPADKPVSWKYIEQIGQKLTTTDASGSPTQIAWQFGFFASFRSPQWYAQNFYEIMRQYGQDDLYVNGKPAANTEPVKKALGLINDFTNVYKIYDPNFLNNWFADFPKGRVAMVLAGTWFAPAARQNNPNVRFGVAPHPVLDPNDRSTYKNIEWAWGWSINSAKPPEQQQLAQDFLAFMLGKKGETDQAAWWMANMGYEQPSKAFLQSKAYMDTLSAQPWMKEWTDAFQMFQIGYVQHSYDEAGAALVRAIDRVVYDKMSPEDSANLLQSELQRL